MIIEKSSWIEGPRWKFNASFIRKGALVFDLQIVELTEEKSLFTKTIFFVLRGEEDSVYNYIDAIEQLVEDYNENRRSLAN